MFGPPRGKTAVARAKPAMGAGKKLTNSSASSTASSTCSARSSSGSSGSRSSGAIKSTAGAVVAASPLRRAPQASSSRQASQSSLLSGSAAPSGDQSTSRMSLASDTTTASACSAASPALVRKSSSVSLQSTLSAGGPELKRRLSTAATSGGARSQSQVSAFGSTLSSSRKRVAATAPTSSAKTTTTKTTTATSSASGNKIGLSTQIGARTTTTIRSQVVAAAAPPAGTLVGCTAATSATSAAARRNVPTVAMSIREKDQQIKLLIKERDEHKFRAEEMARKVEDWREKFEASELERSHVTSEADDEVVELRRLAQEFEDENKRLAERLLEGHQSQGDLQFKLDELEIERTELRRQLEERQEQLEAMEGELASRCGEDNGGGGGERQQLMTERLTSKVKYEREIEELREQLVGRDEQIMQLRSSLEMRKNEVGNLQVLSSDLEKKLKIEVERNERHLKRIDEINLQLKAAEAKLATKGEENEMQERQVRQLRQDLRSAEEKLEQLSLARKRDVEILHSKLAVARGQRGGGSTTPTSACSPTGQPTGGGGGGSITPAYKTPTPQDEIVRLQMELRDLKDQLIDREAELDCNRRDLEVIRRKMETRTLEVDCNNQELARRCQDLLEQNRQSEETVKQLLISTTEHSAQLMRATEDLKEANGKCSRLRQELAELEEKFDKQLEKCAQFEKENGRLRQENGEQREQLAELRERVDSLNEQVGELCQQLDAQTSGLLRDRELLADQLSQQEIESAQMRQELATARQDLRTSKLQTQECVSERDRLRQESIIKEKYISSRNEIIESMRCELDDCKRSLVEYKGKIEQLRESARGDIEQTSREFKGQLETLRGDIKLKTQECQLLRQECEQLHRQLEDLNSRQDLEVGEKFDEIRQKHSVELDELKVKLKLMEEQYSSRANAEQVVAGATGSSRAPSRAEGCDVASDAGKLNGQQQSAYREGALTPSGGNAKAAAASKREEYETQIDFLNSLVVDMQRKCDDYKSRLAQLESTENIMSEFNHLLDNNNIKPMPDLGNSRSSTLKRSQTNGNGNVKSANDAQATLTRQTKVVRIVDPSEQQQLQLLRQHQHQLQKPVRISGRPYCDICQIFDVHHTIYCPKVSEKLALRQGASQTSLLDTDNNNQSAANNNNYLKDNNHNVNVEELFREYEQSLEDITRAQQYATIRRPAQGGGGGSQRAPARRPYCDQCDLFGHTVKSCQSLRVVS